MLVNRVVLFSWQYPAALEEVLAQNKIDWRVKSSYRLEEIKDKAEFVWSTFKPWSNESRDPPPFIDGSFRSEQSRLIDISSNSNFVETNVNGWVGDVCSL